MRSLVRGEARGVRDKGGPNEGSPARALSDRPCGVRAAELGWRARLPRGALPLEESSGGSRDASRTRSKRGGRRHSDRGTSAREADVRPDGDRTGLRQGEAARGRRSGRCAGRRPQGLTAAGSTPAHPRSLPQGWLTKPAGRSPRCEAQAVS